MNIQGTFCTIHHTVANIGATLFRLLPQCGSLTMYTHRLDAVMPELPNILFITLDQWRADALSDALAPSLMALASEATSTVFERHYCQAFPCGPARASLMTGLYAEQHDIRHNDAVLDARHQTLFQLLRTAGYNPTLFGYTDVGDPVGPDADPSRAACNGLSVDTPLNEDAALWIQHLKKAAYDLPVDPRANITSSGIPEHRDEILNARRFDQPTLFDDAHSEAAFLTDRFLQWLPRANAVPFCAHLSYISPHPPFAVAAPFNDMFAARDVAAPCRGSSPAIEAAQHPFMHALLERVTAGKFAPGLQGLSKAQSLETTLQVKAVYAGQVRQVDAHIGRLFDTLRERGQWDNTVVIVTADHGEQLFDHYLLGKTAYFDESAHIPLIVRLPALYTGNSHAMQGRRVSAFTESIDLVPTLLSLANIALPSACQGRSLLPWCSGETPAIWRDEVHWQFDFAHVANGRLSDSLGLTPANSRLDVVRTKRLKYVHFEGMPPVLFDLLNDPHELRNMANELADEVANEVANEVADADRKRSLLLEGRARWQTWRDDV